MGIMWLKQDMYCTAGKAVSIFGSKDRDLSFLKVDGSWRYTIVQCSPKLYLTLAMLNQLPTLILRQLFWLHGIVCPIKYFLILLATHQCIMMICTRVILHLCIGTRAHMSSGIYLDITHCTFWCVFLFWFFISPTECLWAVTFTHNHLAMRSILYICISGCLVTLQWTWQVMCKVVKLLQQE